MNEIKIGNKVVGSNYPCLICFEPSSTYANIEEAKEMMKSTALAGADAVKFQSFDEKIIGKHSEKDRLLKTSINEKNIEFIDGAAKNAGIEWFCTPMFAEAVEFLEPFVNRFKTPP